MFLTAYRIKCKKRYDCESYVMGGRLNFNCGCGELIAYEKFPEEMG